MCSLLSCSLLGPQPPAAVKGSLKTSSSRGKGRDPLKKQQQTKPWPQILLQIIMVKLPEKAVHYYWSQLWRGGGVLLCSSLGSTTRICHCNSSITYVTNFLHKIPSPLFERLNVASLFLIGSWLTDMWVSILVISQYPLDCIYSLCCFNPVCLFRCFVLLCFLVCGLSVIWGEKFSIVLAGLSVSPYTSVTFISIYLFILLSIISSVNFINVYYSMHTGLKLLHFSGWNSKSNFALWNAWALPSLSGLRASRGESVVLVYTFLFRVWYFLSLVSMPFWSSLLFLPDVVQCFWLSSFTLLSQQGDRCILFYNVCVCLTHTHMYSYFNGMNKVVL